MCGGMEGAALVEAMANEVSVAWVRGYGKGSPWGLAVVGGRLRLWRTKMERLMISVGFHSVLMPYDSGCVRQTHVIVFACLMRLCLLLRPRPCWQMGDDFELREYQRKTELVCAEKSIISYKNIQPGEWPQNRQGRSIRREGMFCKGHGICRSNRRGEARSWCSIRRVFKRCFNMNT